MDDSTNTTKTYQVDKHKQLIPLNGSMAHFTCLFEVKNNKTPFNITIVEQGDIHPKQYKLIEDGYINGQIESDGVLKSYFLVLKSQQPCECEVKISLKPKPAHFDTSTGGRQGEVQENNSIPHNASCSAAASGAAASHPFESRGYIEMKPQESYFQLKYIAGISILAIFLYLLYKYRKNIFGTQIVAPSTSF
jgi:hypothetical protein